MSKRKFVICTNWKFPSLNKWYSGMHPQVRRKQAELTKQWLCAEIKKQMPMNFEYFEVLLEANNRYDIDNNMPASKLFVDSLAQMGAIQSDSPNYYKKLTMVVNPDLERGSIRLTAYEIENPAIAGPSKKKTKAKKAKPKPKKEIKVIVG